MMIRRERYITCSRLRVFTGDLPLRTRDAAGRMGQALGLKNVKNSGGAKLSAGRRILPL